MDQKTMKAAIEAVLFVAGDPVPPADLARVLDTSEEQVRMLVREMTDEYNYDMRGIQILEVGEGIQLASRREYGDIVQQALAPTIRQSLSAAALETLAVVAYMQPITRGEIEQIRGVRCEYAVSSLLQKKMIEVVGTKDTLGRPHLYGTTEDFLRVFGLGSLEDLPPLEETGSNEQTALSLDMDEEPS